MRFRCCIALLVLLLCVCHSSRADGRYVPRADHASVNRDVSEPTQKAILVHVDGHERLILQATYKGDVSQFVWLVPTPAKPQVTLFDYPAFHKLGLYTAPRLKYWLTADALLDPALLSAGILARAGKGRDKTAKTVDLLERKQIGVYDVAVLTARDSHELIEWLHVNGYYTDRKIENVASYYLERGWYFTAARINTNRGRAESALREGTLHALQFDSTSRQPVYPLRISSINPGRTKVLLYVCAVHRMQNKAMETVCVRPEHFVPYIATGEDLHWQLGRKADQEGICDWPCTKLYGEFAAGEMKHDLILTRAKNDNFFRAAEVSPPFLENLGAMLAALVLVPFMFPLNILTGVILYFVSERACCGGSWRWATRSLSIYCWFSWLTTPAIAVCVLEPLGHSVGYWPITPILACMILAGYRSCRSRTRKPAPT